MIGDVLCDWGTSYVIGGHPLLGKFHKQKRENVCKRRIIFPTGRRNYVVLAEWGGGGGGLLLLCRISGLVELAGCGITISKVGF